MSWEGLNYEDAIILSRRVVEEDILTSIHIEEYESTPARPSSVRKKSPAISQRLRGIPR